MDWEITKNAYDATTTVKFIFTSQFLNYQCEPYGTPELCECITKEQGIGIITDAVLMAMHLRLKGTTAN